ncbi:MAG: deoxyribonuclease [Candidatus Saccharibacteria bacterium]|jgi:deoxyribonuclease-4|nr:deoxyribonuclease [Candidatus Saccharibacteria bacterium]
MKLGVHISTSGDLIGTPARAAEMGAETIQMFASNPRGWRPTKYTPKKAQEFRAAVAAAGIDPVWFHMIYLVSFGTPDEEQREKSILATQQTLAAADLLGATGVITHMGSHKGLGFEQALERIKDSYTRALAESEKSLLIMEIAAGQGGAIGNSLEELAAQFDVMKGHPRLAVCIDTCHALSAGYELRTPEGLDDFLAKFDSLIGLDRLVVLHLNDSKNDLGAKIDRHENIGEGTIGYDGMRNIINHPKLAHISGVLEVPGMDGKSGPDKENMDRLKALRQ